VISRYLVITLAIAAAVMQISRGSYLEATGLFGLAAGLICLKLALSRPPLKYAAWGSFAVTAIAMIVVFVRRM
jgi:hypothetical protein